MKGLVHLIWADGEVSDDERELLGGVLSNLGLSEDEIQKVGQMMITLPELGDLKGQVPDHGARLEILKVLVATAFADGKVCKKELRFLDKFAEQLEISRSELESIKQETLEAMGEAQ